MTEVHSPAPQDVIRVGQIEIRCLQEAGNGCQMGSFEMRVPPNSNVPPPHSHSLNEELVYVLEGTLRYCAILWVKKHAIWSPATLWRRRVELSMALAIPTSSRRVRL